MGVQRRFSETLLARYFSGEYSVTSRNSDTTPCSFSGYEQIHTLLWVLACWDEYSLRENPVLFKKRYLVVAKPAMQGVEFARGCLKNPPLIEPNFSW